MSSPKKIIIANAGLGNMMFSYALTLAFRKKGIPALLFVSKADAAHQGYELERVFPGVKPKDGIALRYRLWFSLAEKVYSFRIFSYHLPLKWLLQPWKFAGFKEPVLYSPDVFDNLEERTWYGTQCQSWRYYVDCEHEIRKAFSWNETLLSQKTIKVASFLQSCNCVGIHVRRGDYLSPNYKGLGMVCDTTYYQRAFTYIRTVVKNPHFFVFSDDKEWVKENMAGDEFTIVDHNCGTDSWQDMYLMSQCKHQIIANSSFSWWAAYLNLNDNKIVVAPKRWWAYFDHDDVVPDDWVRI